MKRIGWMILLCMGILTACMAQETNKDTQAASKPGLYDRVVTLYAPYAELWEMAGGTVIGRTGSTLDGTAVEETGVAILGEEASPDIDQLVAIHPTLVLMNPQENGEDFATMLSRYRIKWKDLWYNSFAEYESIFRTLCKETGGELEEAYTTGLREEIDKVVASCEGKDALTYAILYADEEKVWMGGEDTLPGSVAKELFGKNITAKTMEEADAAYLLEHDPSIVFVQTFGDKEKVNARLSEWYADENYQTFLAQRTRQITVLPKELFTMPNHRFPQTYQWMAQALYQNK